MCGFLGGGGGADAAAAAADVDEATAAAKSSAIHCGSSMTYVTSVAQQHGPHVSAKRSANIGFPGVERERRRGTDHQMHAQ